MTPTWSENNRLAARLHGEQYRFGVEKELNLRRKRHPFECVGLESESLRDA